MTNPIVEAALSNNVQATTVSVDLINQPIFANWEYTDGSISAAYSADFQAFANIFNQGSNFGNLSAAEQNQLAAAAEQAIYAPIVTDPTTNQVISGGLLALAQNPQLINGYYNGLTVSMANNLDQFLRSLQAGGWNGQDPGTSSSSSSFQTWITNLENWITLSQTGPTVQNVLQGAASAVQTNTTFQASLESIFVGTANNLVEAQLSNLQTALQSSQNALDSLTSVQNIHNDITVSGKGSINFVYLSGSNVYNGDSGFASAYTRAASAHFGQPIIPHIPSSLVTFGTPPITNPALQAIETQEAQLKATIDANLSVMNNSLDSINSVINNTATQTAISTYEAAVNQYNSFISSATQNGQTLNYNDLLKAQQQYINAANQYNSVFWQGRIWPPILDENSINTNGSYDQPNGYQGLNGQIFVANESENPENPLPLLSHQSGKISGI